MADLFSQTNLTLSSASKRRAPYLRDSGACRSLVQAASAGNSIGSTIEGSSFSGLFTRVEIGKIVISSAGDTNGRAADPNEM